MLFRCAGITDSMIDVPGKIALAVFFQGCSFGCDECQNPELQDFNGGFYKDTDDIIDLMESHGDFYEALCLTGGDPLFQKDAVRDLVGKSKFYNVLYTGHYYNDIPYDIVSLFDMVVDGPYIKKLKSGGFPASSNQKIYYR